MPINSSNNTKKSQIIKNCTCKSSLTKENMHEEAMRLNAKNIIFCQETILLNGID